ncbi:TPA: hypothetical protein QDB15_005901 [Burkholderia vietnamiensis]|uniref:hypothetical protein n=1 Tax=Burkholderia vietnamiensis TaxID=60552 RepID=UPI001CF113B6|nr:hypothetical protein [Burkholderia vietnamiensis]MCA8211776.1 hypothetical protein [Burkholderia vietnamiensis]HDR9122036.1 hypothetical protein [Burkholderia vietnamiensis]HDR9284642.1 hypothetical protein [Burkholderia vietnamiensis]
MESPYEIEGIASRQVDHVATQRYVQARPSDRTALEFGTSPTCATNFPMLTPHEIATLMLVAHAPELVSIERPDLLPLLNGNLVKIDRCRRCRGKPQMTPLGEALVVRLCKTTRRASKDALSYLDRSRDPH